MNIIHRYILREIVKPFVLILFSLTFVLLMGKILQIMDMMVNKGIRLYDIARLVFYLMPSLLMFTLPISLLIAILIGLGRLSSDNEVLIFKASGLSLHTFLIPVGAAASAAFLLTLLTGMVWVPHGNWSTKNLLFDIAQQKATIGIKEKVFNDDFRGLLLYADRVPVQGNVMEDVIVSDNRIIQEPSTIIARRAYLVSDPRSLTVTLRLESGSTHTVSLKERNYRKLSFSTYDVNLDLAAAILEARDKKASTDMTFAELLDSIRRIGTDNEVGRELAVELHKKITLPLSCLILGLLAIPLGVKAHRSVKSRGFTVGMITVMIYYLLQLGGEALVETGYLPPVLGIWSPDLLFGCAALYLFVKASREEPLRIQSLMDEISLKIREWRQSA